VDATKLVANWKEDHGNSTCVLNEKIGGKGAGKGGTRETDYNH
jgi:hypothetical protein